MILLSHWKYIQINEIIKTEEFVNQISFCVIGFEKNIKCLRQIVD